MRRSLAVTLSVLAIGCLSCDRSSQGPQIDELAVKEVIQKDWQEDNVFRVYLGTCEVVRDREFGEVDPSRGRLPASGMRYYKAWEEVGLIKIRLLKDLTSRFSGWDNWNKLWLEGVDSVVHIEATEKGEPLMKSPENPEGDEHAFLLVSQGQFLVEKILRSEPLKLGIDDYRVVLGTHTASYTPEAQAYFKEIGSTRKKARKFRALLKYDPFDSTWKVLTQDIADRDLEFPSDNINALLRSWGK